MNAWEPKPSHKSSQMTEEVDSISVPWSEDENEDDDHKSCAPNLAFQNWSYDVQSVPVYDNVANYHSNDTEKSCRSSTFDRSRIYQRTKYVSSDPWYQVDYECFDDTISMLDSG